MAHPIGEREAGILRLSFDRRLKLEFHGSKVTSDAGLLPHRELNDAVGLSEIAGDVLTDSRRWKNGRHGLVGQFRQSVFGRLGGYDDVNDADRFSLDPVMRWINETDPLDLPCRGRPGGGAGRCDSTIVGKALGDCSQGSFLEESPVETPPFANHRR